MVWKGGLWTSGGPQDPLKKFRRSDSFHGTAKMGWPQSNSDCRVAGAWGGMEVVACTGPVAAVFQNTHNVKDVLKNITEEVEQVI